MAALATLKLWAMTVAVVSVVAALVAFALNRLGKVADNGERS